MTETRVPYTVCAPATPVRCVCGALISGNHWPYRNDPEGQFAHHVAVCHGSREPERWRFVPIGALNRRLAATRSWA